MIKKILVANRGEIAMRIFRTCRVMNISTVAVYTHVDRGALHVRYAEEAYCISESPEDTSYLKPELILSIAKKTGAAIHPGYGFLSENADFARRCEEEGVIFIGPGADIIAKMGIKTEARKIMREAGLPIVPGTEAPVQGIEEVKTVAKEVGYPIMLKALAGGGGKGMRLVRSEEEVEAALRLSQSEAGTSFGNDAVYIEKYIENPHHIEVQIMGDKYGNVVHLGERECSIQRRNQKVIEESPSPFVKEDTRKKMLKVAVEACRRIGYYSAGTLEFMMDKDQNFYFLEMNTRLQVEHPITEQVVGVDLVKEQIKIADGQVLQLKQKDIQQRGHAIECRICAEDTEMNFMPSPGIIKQITEPNGIGVRIDSYVYEGYEIPIYYDPMIGKLIVWATSREYAIERMRRVLHEYKLTGVKNNISYLRAIMDTPDFVEGHYDTGFIAKNGEYLQQCIMRTSERSENVALIAAYMDYLMNLEENNSGMATDNRPISKWKEFGLHKGVLRI